MNGNAIYSANITAGALRLRESRLLATAMLDREVDSKTLIDLAVDDNLLQLPNRSSTRRVARLLCQRLNLLERPALQRVANGSGNDATQILFAAALCHSQLLWDFMDLTVRDQYRLGATTLSKSVWPAFLEGCEARDPAVASWTPRTQEKVRQVCYTILREAGYICDSHQLRLMTVRVFPGIGEALSDSPAAKALPLMELCP